VPDVRVTATLGAERRVTTSDAQGRFRLENLAPGRYDLEARLAGFETDFDENVTVSAATAVVWNRTLLIGGTHGSMRPSGPDPTPPAVARPIYAAVLRDIFKDGVPERLVIDAASALAIGPNPEDWATTLLGAPAELRAKLGEPKYQRLVWLNAEALPPGTRLIPRSAIDDAFMSAPKLGLTDRWEAFRRLYGVPSFVSLSRAIVTTDGRDALVYFVHACGDLCGEHTLLWLRRIPADGAWIVRARRLFWVS